MPEISVIVPVYKVEPYLRRCVDSILAQSFNSFELILVDDGSPDNCGMICDDYAKTDVRIHVIHQENRGLSAARNTGINWAYTNSKSKWLSFIDSDDWVHKDYLLNLLTATEQFHLQLSVCRFCEVSGPTSEYDDTVKTLIVNAEEFFVNNPVNAIVAWGKLYNKELFKEIRFPEGKLHEDEYTTYKVLFASTSVAVADAPLYYYFKNENGIMRSPWTIEHMDSYEALQGQIEFFDTHGYQVAKRSVIRRYLLNIQTNITRFSDQIPIRNKYLALKHQYFSKYARCLDVNDERDAWVLTKVYPFKMKVYWILKSCKKIFQRQLRRSNINARGKTQ